jgi:hypothetical protein
MRSDNRLIHRGLLVLGLATLGIWAAGSPSFAQSQHGSAPQTSSHPSPGKSLPDLPEDKPGHTHYLDFKNGFRGIKFGASIDSFKDLNVVSAQGSIKKCTKKDDDLMLGQFKVDEIVYQFVNGKFQGVSISASGADAQSLLQVFQSAYGPGSRMKNGPPQFFWSGKTANANLLIDAQGRAVAWIGNNELQKEFDKEYGQLLLTASAQM